MPTPTCMHGVVTGNQMKSLASNKWTEWNVSWFWYDKINERRNLFVVNGGHWDQVLNGGLNCVLISGESTNSIITSCNGHKSGGYLNKDFKRNWEEIKRFKLSLSILANCRFATICDY